MEFVVYRRLLYFLDLGSGSGSGSETIDIDRLIRMNWDLGNLLLLLTRISTYFSMALPRVVC